VKRGESSCLIQQHGLYFILCDVNQLEASEQTEREGAGKERQQRKEKAMDVVGWRGDTEHYTQV